MNAFLLQVVTVARQGGRHWGDSKTSISKASLGSSLAGEWGVSDQQAGMFLKEGVAHSSQHSHGVSTRHGLSGYPTILEQASVVRLSFTVWCK